MEDNDGREPIGYLPEIAFDGADRPVFQVIDESTGEIVYTVRHTAPKFRAPVYNLYTGARNFGAVCRTV